MMAWQRLTFGVSLRTLFFVFLFSFVAIELGAQEESKGQAPSPPRLQGDLARFVPADLDVLAEFRDFHELLRAPEKSARLFDSFKAALPKDQEDLWDQFEAKLKVLTPELLKQTQPRLALGFRLESGIPTILVIWPASLAAKSDKSGPKADLHKLRALTKSLCAAIPNLKLGEADTYRSAQRQELIDFGSLACRDGILFWCSNPFLLRRCLRQDPKTSMAMIPGRKPLASAFAMRAAVGALRKHDLGVRVNKALADEAALATLYKCWLDADLLNIELDWRADLAGSLKLRKKGASGVEEKPVREQGPLPGFSLLVDSQPRLDKQNAMLNWTLKWLAKRLKHPGLQLAIQDLERLSKSELTWRSAQRFGFYLPPAKGEGSTDACFYCGPAPGSLEAKTAAFKRYEEAFQGVFARRSSAAESASKYFSQGPYYYRNRSGVLNLQTQRHLTTPGPAAWKKPALILKADLPAFESIVKAEGWADSPWVKPLLDAMKKAGTAWHCSLKASADHNAAQLSWIVKTPPRKSSPK